MGRDVTLAFNCLPEVDVRTRVAAATAAGFHSLGLSLRWLRVWEQDHDYAELDEALTEFGARLTEFEVLRCLADEPDPKEDLAFELCARYDVKRIQIIGDYTGTIDDAARRLSRLADRAAEQDINIVLEFLPFTNIPTAKSAVEILQKVDKPNALVCLDSWHIYRGKQTFADLEGTWEWVGSIQINDGPVEQTDPDLLFDCLHYRETPGRGEFDLVTLMRLARDKAPRAQYAVEVIGDRLKAMDPFDACADIRSGITTLFEEVDHG